MRLLFSRSISLIFVCLIGGTPSFSQVSFKEIYSLGQKDGWDQALMLLEESQKQGESKSLDALEYKIIKWLALLKGKDIDHPFEAYRDFLKESSHWPWAATLRKKAEVAWGWEGDILVKLNWFKKYPPRTMAGAQRYLAALRKKGDRDVLVRTAKNVWHRHSFKECIAEKKACSLNQEAFLKAYGHFLNHEDHQTRSHHLIQKGLFKEALTLTDLLHPKEVSVLKARLALKRGDKNALDLAWNIVGSLHAQFSRPRAQLLLDMIAYLNRTENPQVISLFLKVPKVVLKYFSKEEIWRQRYLTARFAFQKGRYQDAYKIVKDHGFKNGEFFEEAEWFLGWVSLCYLKKSDQGLKHFKAVHRGVKTPLSKAKAAYWVGRALEAQFKTQEARKWYGLAAKQPTTFYGYLGAQKTWRRPQISLKPYLPISSTKIETFAKTETAQIFKKLMEVGEHKHAFEFLYLEAKRAKTAEKAYLLMDLAKKEGAPFGVSISKLLSRFGSTRYQMAYPTVLQGHPPHLDRTFVLALIRQESSFNPFTISPVGALGLMQVMPTTAEEVCKKSAITFEKEKLLSDPIYNVKVGSLYLIDRIEGFKGSYIMAAAAYNAGPAPVLRWLKENGDPRGMSREELINWIEAISYPETRTYVKRVLANLWVYQTILAKES